MGSGLLLLRLLASERSLAFLLYNAQQRIRLITLPCVQITYGPRLRNLANSSGRVANDGKLEH